MFYKCDVYSSSLISFSPSGILLNAILSSLPQQYVSDHVFDLVDQIVQCQETAFPVFYLLRNLGLLHCNSGNL